MAYEAPNRITYLFPSTDIGAGDKTYRVVGPKGKKGKIYDYGVVGVTEAFTAVTTASLVSVGIGGGDVDAFGEEFSMLTTAIGGGRTVRSTHGHDPAAVDDFIIADIPADTDVLLTLLAPTGGTPAGIGLPILVIDWDW